MLLAAAAAAALTACGQGKESQEKETGSKTEVKSDDVPVSYTHLDVYKRQVYMSAGNWKWIL